MSSSSNPSSSTTTASTALGVAPRASTSASASARFIPPPPPRYNTSWGGSRRVPPPTNFSLAHGGRRRWEGRAPNSADVSRNSAAAPPTIPVHADQWRRWSRNSAGVVSQPQDWESGWETAAAPRSTFAPVMSSTEEGSSSSGSAPFPSSSTVASTPTDTRPASAASSTTTPWRNILLGPSASRSAPAVETSAVESTSSAPVLTKISDLALTSASSPANIFNASREPGASAATTAPGVAPNATAATAWPNNLLSKSEWPRLGTVPKKKGATQPQASGGSSEHVSPLLESGREIAADPTSTFAPVTWSTEKGSSSSASAPFPSSSTVASTPTDTEPASTASSTTRPSRDSTLVPSASGSAPAVETRARTAPGPGESTSSAPVAISDLAMDPRALNWWTTSTPGAAPNASATASVPGAAPRIPVVGRYPGQHAFGGNGIDMSALAGLAPYPNPVWTLRPEEVMRLVPRCCECGRYPVKFWATPCGHVGICTRCYDRKFECPCCGKHAVWLLRR